MKVLNYLLTCAVLLFLFATLPPSGNTVTVLALLVTTIAVTVIVLHAVPRRIPIVGTPLTHGLPREELRLRGSFRRQRRPDAPGRPLPRAPGWVAGTHTR